MDSKDIKLALDLMLVMGMYEKFNRALQSMKNDSPIFTAAKNVTDLPELANEIDKVFTNGTIELTEATAVIYVETFTKKELKKLIKFYRSDVGKKFVDESLHIENKVIGISTVWMTGALAKLTDIILVYTNKITETTSKINSAIPVSTKLH